MKKLGAILGVLILAAAIFLAFFVPAAWFSQPAADAPSVTISISETDSSSSISSRLKEKGITTTTFGYSIYALIDSATHHPKRGDYKLKPGMSYRTIARLLTTGPAREEVEITLAPGRSLTQDLETLAPFGVQSQAFISSVGDTLTQQKFDPAWHTEFSFLAVIPAGQSLEGYLFPDTYRVWKDQLPQSLIRKQLEEFSKHVDGIQAAAKAQNLSAHEVVTLASIIEKEVAATTDRKVVAGIFLRRLSERMPLQSDATVNYFTHAGRTRPTLKDLEIESAYNTYQHKGLPPGPISNPSTSALDAVANPTASEYRYFLTDESGKTYYAKTFEEHIRNRKRAFGE